MEEEAEAMMVRSKDIIRVLKDAKNEQDDQKAVEEDYEQAVLDELRGGGFKRSMRKIMNQTQGMCGRMVVGCSPV